MDIQDYLNKIKSLRSEIPNRLQEQVYSEISESITKSLKYRIFTKGLDSNETEIGEYSQKSISATQDKFVKKSAFVPTSKSGKTMQLKGGYKELKQVQGLKSENVNLVYSGDLRKSVQSNTMQNGFEIGFTSVDEAEKAKKIEDKYGKTIFRLSENEILKLNKSVLAEINKIHKSMFYVD